MNYRRVVGFTHNMVVFQMENGIYAWVPTDENHRISYWATIIEAHDRSSFIMCRPEEIPQELFVKASVRLRSMQPDRSYKVLGLMRKEMGKANSFEEWRNWVTDDDEYIALAIERDRQRLEEYRETAKNLEEGDQESQNLTRLDRIYRISDLLRNRFSISEHPFLDVVVAALTEEDMMDNAIDFLTYCSEDIEHDLLLQILIHYNPLLAGEGDACDQNQDDDLDQNVPDRDEENDGEPQESWLESTIRKHYPEAFNDDTTDDEYTDMGCVSTETLGIDEERLIDGAFVTDGDFIYLPGIDQQMLMEVARHQFRLQGINHGVLIFVQPLTIWAYEYIGENNQFQSMGVFPQRWNEFKLSPLGLASLRKINKEHSLPVLYLSIFNSNPQTFYQCS